MGGDRARTILFYNTSWLTVPDALDDCPARCRLVSDPRLLPEADVVVFHIPTLAPRVRLPERVRRRPAGRQIRRALSYVVSRVPRLAPRIRVPKYPGQRWVAWSMESDVNYPLLANATFMRQFDLTMTYRRDTDVWHPYLEPTMRDGLVTPPREKTEPALAVYFASNCRDRSGRHEYVKALMTYLDVDSYGRCLKNRELPVDEGSKTKLEAIARYKFTLAFENSISPDYVTEKFFDPLIAGSVPVYLGAPNVGDFAPGDRCFINVADFDGPRALAEYLRALGRDDDRYAEYLAWKRTGLRREFLDLLDALALHPLCRLCMKSGDGS